MVSWRQRVRNLEAENAFLRKKIEELERLLLAYENPHTPPSKSRKKPPKTESKGIRGAKKGHPRWERKRPEPTGRIEYVEKTCPDCHTTLGEPVKSISKIIEEMPELQPVEVTEHVVNHYKCPNVESAL